MHSITKSLRVKLRKLPAKQRILLDQQLPVRSEKNLKNRAETRPPLAPHTFCAHKPLWGT